MGTKNEPGQFDCYANAEPDEPMFVLLGRDPMAAGLVRLWALIRHDAGEDEKKVSEALKCADAMDAFVTARGKNPTRFVELLEMQTAGMDDHPDNYEHSCICNECAS